MTPKKQVSPVIRISREKRDASARATHLEAATRKFLVTTIERKQMSTKTNFKRIALVAAAALGIGVLSAIPSSATVSDLTVTVANGTSTIYSGTTGGTSDTRTAALITVTGLFDNNSDSITVQAAAKSVPTDASRVALLGFRDTLTTAGYIKTVVETHTAVETVTALTHAGVSVAESKTIATALYNVTGASGATGYVGARFFLQLESGTGTTKAGTYTYAVTVKSFDGQSRTWTSTVKDVSITVAALASASKVADPYYSKLYIGPDADATADSAVTAVATASNTPVGYLELNLRNASNADAAAESVTVTIDKGQIGTSTNRGRSVVLAYSTDMSINIYADGTAGKATINVSTPSVTFGAKTVTFYAKTPATLVATALKNPLAVGSNSAALAVDAKDANGIRWAGSLYVYSATAGVISDAATECTYDAVDDRHECSLAGVAAGTSAITVRDADVVADATVSSTAVTMTVHTAPIADFKLAFDKTTYAPGEKATLTLTVVDADGKSLPGTAYTNLFSTAGITFSTAAGNGTADFSSERSPTTASLASQAAKYAGLVTPVKTYTVYMPAAGGTFQAIATGSTALPAAAQIEHKSAAVTITDNGAAALAAVNALATTVASLKTLITTLTNLVLKIQKKVKA